MLLDDTNLNLLFGGTVGEEAENVITDDADIDGEVVAPTAGLDGYITLGD